MDIVVQTIWSFVRGDSNAADFERFVYGSSQLEGVVGKDKYLELLSAGYREKPDIHDLKEMLGIWLEQNTHRTCNCITWNSNQNISISYETRPDVFFQTFDVLKERNAWLELARCKMCGQAWYIAADTCDDVYCLLRLTEEQTREIIHLDKWPAVFDESKNVWPNPLYS